MTVTYAILGAGQRGTIYGRWIAAHPDRARVVAIADPDPVARERLAAECVVPAGAVFASWQELLGAGTDADSAIIATQDRDHVAPALAALAAGHHVLLEKPMALTAEDCRAIARAATASDRLFAVCHVLRYTRYTRLVRRLIAEGAIGEPVSMQHLEPVGWFHFAHSFVRGNWRNEATSSPFLLAKCTHDLDWMAHVMGTTVARVASFGSLRHFTAANAPEGATDRCTTCPHQQTCPYSAVDIYLTRPVGRPGGWPGEVLASTPEGVPDAVRTGPYGRCVYACDNDAVDHQVVAIEFADGTTGTLTVTAFTPLEDRQTRIFGTRGQLEGDGATVRVFDFATRAWTEHPVDGPEGGTGDRHGGGDGGLMADWTAAVAANDATVVGADVEATLAAHLAVFAAEESRHSGRVVGVNGVTS
ncbi:Gfo/Idh/MocA family oxidoreductase [Propioniciclava sp. MC1595]|uniref:Gfo/Idh/MocA family protein n=1 Tax=Propioniciclava sp. MC1595 TaxID=2760308 RepID=UPI0016624EE4|nr:Gfo/Idh/MocA family oxidoreductase [Propioniciclava sp. MC1595]MBB1494568.1 Gfo/Idh/MocA family oxidoreductase [Propioniciclava sp. MC1595]